MSFKYTYAITVCNEGEELNSLLSFITKEKLESDEIVVLVDKPKLTDRVSEVLEMYKEHCKVHYADFHGEYNGDFSAWKNLLSSLCSGDYIVNLDADELPSEGLMDKLRQLQLYMDKDELPEVMIIPRANYVNGITMSHISMWGWSMDAHGRINWPDFQMRVYKNTRKIQWNGVVHERIVGYLTFMKFESDEYIIHVKDLDRQILQNNRYEEYRGRFS